ncbi:hypothetical protein KXR53_19710 [Inquilinus limosus]|uniref:hypothetical protein n=1 Tax=Inquilinus limosus TaxID=171674 RepID=UPI003F17EA47
MSATLYGDAVASGEDTLTEVDSTSRMHDLGLASIGGGEVTATAAAEGEDAFASASTDASVSGADIIIANTKHSSGTGEDGVYDQSATKFTAIDVPLIDLPTLVIANTTETHDSDADIDLDGNHATATFDAQASGQDSLVTADAYALTVEDEFSQSTVMTTSAVG